MRISKRDLVIGILLLTASFCSSQDSITRDENPTIENEKFILEHAQRTLNLETSALPRCINEGNFGRIYLGKRKNKEKIVIKIPFNDSKNDLIEEYKIFTILKDQHFIAKATRFVHEKKDNIMYMIMPYYNGGPLSERLHKLISKPHVIHIIMAQIAFGLRIIHQHGIVHRDLKPENILTDKIGNIYIADFGQARTGITEMGPEAGLTDRVGSPLYTDINVYMKDRKYGKAVDLYSLGMIYYTILVQDPDELPELSFIYNQIIDEPSRPCKLEVPPLEFDQNMPVEKDLIYGLVKYDYTKRLGGIKGIDEVMKHPFFMLTNWENLFMKNEKMKSHLRNRFSEKFRDDESDSKHKLGKRWFKKKFLDKPSENDNNEIGKV